MTSKIKFLSISLSLCFLAVSFIGAHAQQRDSLSYDIYFGDRKAGFAHVWLDSKDHFKSIFEFNDRGRGPHLEESVRLNSDGLIVNQTVTGHNYLKEPVDETFEVKNDSAVWRSSIESGSVAFDKKSFYLSVQGILGNELLIRKLLNTPESSIPLLPKGNASLAQTTSHVIEEELQLKLVTLTGFEPVHYWMDNENRMFAIVTPWFGMIREDYEAHIDTLRSLQDKEVNNYYLNLADKLIHKTDQPIAITDVSLFDSKSATLKTNQTVIIEGNTIKKIGDAENISISNSAKVIDGKNKTLLPGLFDMHTHGDKLDGILNLAAGVTSVRDMANSLDLPELREKFNNNILVGPRIVAISGFIDQAGPYAGPTGKIVETLEEGLEAVEFYHNQNYQQIKLYSSIDPEWVESLSEKAHRLGMRVSGHIPAYMLAEEAVQDGYDEIQHVNMIVLNFLSDTLDTRTPVRFSEVAKQAYKLDLKAPQFQNFMQQLKANDVVVDPTVSCLLQSPVNRIHLLK